MKKRSDNHSVWEAHREKIMGLGATLPRKTYYPKLQQKLDELERFKALLDESNDCIFLLAVPSLDFIDFNRSASRQLHCTPEELAGIGLAGIVPPEALAEIRELVDAGGGEGRDRATIITLMGTCDGNRLPAEITLRLVTFHDQRYGVAVARDITERKAAEEAMLNAAKREAQTAERIRAVEELAAKDRMMIQQSRMAAMGEMLGNIAHQWRQPLNVLGLRLQHLGVAYETGAFSGQLLEANISGAMEILRQLSLTIDEFRRLSYPDQDRSVFSVGEVISSTLTMIRAGFTEHYITVEEDIVEDVTVCGYRNGYAQALLNILMNARDALLERRVPYARVRLAAWLESGCSVVTVTDNAGGIEEKIMDRIFDAYFTTKAQGKGTGVGLFMAKLIVENSMGGRLTCRNVTGGAEFRIEIQGLENQGLGARG